jgi:hypothetical protein
MTFKRAFDVAGSRAGLLGERIRDGARAARRRELARLKGPPKLMPLCG